MQRLEDRPPDYDGYGGGSGSSSEDDGFGGRLARQSAPPPAAAFLLTEDFLAQQRQAAAATSADTYTLTTKRLPRGFKDVYGYASYQASKEGERQRRRRRRGGAADSDDSDNSATEGLSRDELAGLQVRGYACRLFDAPASGAPPLSSVPLPPWCSNGGEDDEGALTDRFDVRLLLSSLPSKRRKSVSAQAYDADLPSGAIAQEVQGERWRSLALREASRRSAAAAAAATTMRVESLDSSPSTASAAEVETEPATRLWLPASSSLSLPPEAVAALRAAHLPLQRYKLIEATARRVAASQQLEVMLRLHQSGNPAFTFLNEGDMWHPLYAALREAAAAAAAAAGEGKDGAAAWPEPEEVSLQELQRRDEAAQAEQGAGAAARASASFVSPPRLGLCDYGSDASSSSASDDEGDKPEAALVPPPQPMLQVAQLLAARAAAAPALLAALLEKEAHNPRFAFLQSWSPYNGWWLATLKAASEEAEAAVQEKSVEGTAAPVAPAPAPATPPAPALPPPPAAPPQVTKRSLPNSNDDIAPEAPPNKRPRLTEAALAPASSSAHRTYITEWGAEEESSSEEGDSRTGINKQGPAVEDDKDTDAAIDAPTGLAAFDDDEARDAFYREFGGEEAPAAPALVSLHAKSDAVALPVVSAPPPSRQLVPAPAPVPLPQTPAPAAPPLLHASSSITAPRPAATARPAAAIPAAPRQRDASAALPGDHRPRGALPSAPHRPAALDPRFLDDSDSE